MEDAHEKQALRGRGRARLAPVARRERRVDALRGAAALADLRERAGDRAHHLVEEAVARDVYGQDRPLGRGRVAPGRAGLAADAHLVDRAHGGPGLVGALAGEGGEVVPSDQTRGGGLHGAEVQGARDVPGGGRLGGALRAPLEDPVAVMLAPGAEPGAPPRRDLVDGQDRHVVGQEGVEAREQPGAGGGGPGLEAHELPQRVDPGVGAAGPDDAHLLAQDDRQGALDLALDRAHVGLHLPAREVGAGVLDRQAQRACGRGEASRWIHRTEVLRHDDWRVAAAPGPCHRGRVCLEIGRR